MMELLAYILCTAICALIWIWNGRCIAQGIKEHVISEVYIHVGMGIFFTLLTFELTVGNLGAWARLDILWLQIIGFVLYAPAIYLVAASHKSLEYKGKPTSERLATTKLIDTGIYSIIRQPMTLGMAFFSVAIILLGQSVLSVILGASSLFCFWMSARAEAEYNIRKFGAKYKKYMERVPMWNFLKGAKNKKLSS